MNLSDMKVKKGVPQENESLHEGTECELEEHPWLTIAQAKRIAKDHLTKDPDYYEEEDED
jgi:hypothetical protein